MDQAFDIIQMLHQQIPIDEIEKRVDWENLTQADYENLFAEVDLLRGAKSGFELLGLMYKSAKDRDYWLETRILAAVIARPETDIDKGKLLKRMSYCLELIRPSLTKIPRSDPQHLQYRRYLCDYVFLSARLLDEAGDIDKALKEYIAAQKAYSEYNFNAEAKQIDESIGRLQRLKRQGDQLITLQMLVDRRNQIEKEYSDLSVLYQEKHSQLEVTASQIQLKESELEILISQIKEHTGTLEEIMKGLQKLKEETLDFENRKENSQAWLEQIEQEKTSLVEQVINLREQSQALETRVAQTALRLNDRLAALQAQIDLKNSELEKNTQIAIQKTHTLNELDNLIEQRRHELALIEEQMHNDEVYLIELSKRRTDSEAKPNLEDTLAKEPVLGETAAKPHEEMAVKLERYKKSLKASRVRKTTKTDQDSNQG